jgi:hypothetical protein
MLPISIIRLTYWFFLFLEAISEDILNVAYLYHKTYLLVLSFPGSH